MGKIKYPRVNLFKKKHQSEEFIELESHSDYDYKDLLKELNESEKEHKKDLRLFLDLLCKYKVIIK